MTILPSRETVKVNGRIDGRVNGYGVDNVE